MTGSDRREEILRRIQCGGPVSGKKLADLFQVSRQVIVQDIALIRAAGYDIISTNRGYIWNEPNRAEREFKVRHSDQQLEEELCAIVDLGGCVEDVVVDHSVYGRIKAPLGINSRRKVFEFLEDIQSGKSSPLNNLTSGYHCHHVTADSEETLDMIEEVLDKKGFLVREK